MNELNTQHKIEDRYTREDKSLSFENSKKIDNPVESLQIPRKKYNLSKLIGEEIENPVFPKLVYSTLPMRILSCFFLGLDMLIIKVIWKNKQAK